MSQRLIDLLAEAAEQGTAKRANTARLLKHWEEIEDALKAGYTVKTVWEVMSRQGWIAMNYDAFRRSLYRLRQRKAAASSVPSTQSSPPAPFPNAPITPAARKPTSPAKPTAELGKLQGFVWNPVPNEEELFGSDEEED
ncbi:TraK family protein [Methylococcus sp. EFPC2]|uniref:TraK family protein n=1 Tax=Methylococcus sp. EFPC2 TaxID=2812648 RepID=UPI001966DD57|nr:TraK family protein [Methylococcus sp. EFPC2]QSA99326.1 hypothetical protein JWZ97_19855 [Methylococcus sp. EFPC2]